MPPMEGNLIATSACRLAILVDTPEGHAVFACRTFAPSFQLLAHRVWFGAEQAAWRLLYSLPEHTLRRALEVVPNQRSGTGDLVEHRAPALRQRLLHRLQANDIKVYRFNSLQYRLIRHPQQTLLTNLNRVGRREPWDSSHATLQELREAITLEMSRLLAERGTTKESWDSVYRAEPWYTRWAISAGAAATGLIDVAEGLGEAAGAVVDVAGDIADGVGAAVKFQLDLQRKVLEGDLAGAEAQVRALGGQVRNGVDEIVKLLQEGKRVFDVLMSDPVIGLQVVQYGLAWADATPRVEKLRGSFRIGGDVLIALALTVGTRGAGAGAGAALLARNFGMFSGKLVAMLGKAYRMMRKAMDTGPEVIPPKSNVFRELPPKHREPPPKQDNNGRNEPPIPPPGMARFEPPCFQPGSKIPADKYPEYDRQLKGQEAGLNDMTVEEYVEGRRRFAECGRVGKKEQCKARTEYEGELRDRYEKELENEGILGAEAVERARSLAKDRMRTLAALHNPDQIAGGGAAVTDFGDGQVNSSIGSHWKSRVAALDEVVGSIPPSQRKNLKMHVKLERCK